MDDDELIRYCDAHAETPRALFHASQIRRMFELAERPVPREVTAQPNGFWSMREDMKELVHAAINRRNRPGLFVVSSDRPTCCGACKIAERWSDGDGESRWCHRIETVVMPRQAPPMPPRRHNKQKRLTKKALDKRPLLRVACRP